jgi:hypothetical protein
MIGISMEKSGPLFQKLPPLVLREVLKAQVTGLTDYIFGKVVEKTPVNTGALRNSIQTEIDVSEREVTGRILTNIEYAIPVEFGTLPHFPPIDALEYWARRKFQLSAEEARDVAWRVARKIARKGTEGHHMFKKGLEEGERMASRVSEDIALTVTTELGG